MLQQRKPNCSAYDSGVQSLARREHGSEELRVKLKRKGFDEEEVEQAIDRLRSHDYLNDDRYCEAYINMRRRRGYGPIKIKQEMKTRGVTSGLIEKHLQTFDDAWFSQAQRVWEKKFGQQAVDAQERAKQYRFLQYRGFTTEHIHTILN